MFLECGLLILSFFINRALLSEKKRPVGATGLGGIYQLLAGVITTAPAGAVKVRSPPSSVASNVPMLSPLTVTLQLPAATPDT